MVSVNDNKVKIRLKIVPNEYPGDSKVNFKNDLKNDLHESAVKTSFPDVSAAQVVMVNRGRMCGAGGVDTGHR